MKICRGCHKEKDISEFYPDKQNKDGLSSWCKVCMRAHSARRRITYPKENYQWAKNNPEKRKSSTLKHLYGIDLEEYNKLILQQNNKCVICGKESNKVLCVDHDHETGKIRGLLCRECNFAIGLFHNDYALLIKAANYIKDN